MANPSEMLDVAAYGRYVFLQSLPVFLVLGKFEAASFEQRVFGLQRLEIATQLVEVFQERFFVSTVVWFSLHRWTGLPATTACTPGDDAVLVGRIRPTRLSSGSRQFDRERRAESWR
jgi:hypothetical protein